MVKTRYFAEKKARSNLVCFKDMADQILKELRKNSIKVFVGIVVAATKIIKADILQMLNVSESSGSGTSSGNPANIPQSRHPIRVKKVGICQSITQASRPHITIAPVPFGVGVDLDRSIEFKWLINHLSKWASQYLLMRRKDSRNQQLIVSYPYQ